jgi:hypothetical protein
MFWYVVILGAIGAVFAAARVRGPLEALVARIARLVERYGARGHRDGFRLGLAGDAGSGGGPQ